MEPRRVLAGLPFVVAMSLPDAEEKISVQFSEPVLQVDATDFLLLRNGQSLGSGLLSVASISDTEYQVQLPVLADSSYELNLEAASSDIRDLDDNALAADAAVQWLVEQSSPTWQLDFTPAAPVSPSHQRLVSLGDSMTLEEGGSWVHFVRDDFDSSLFTADVLAGAGWKVELIRSVWETQVRNAGYGTAIVFAGLPDLTSTNSNAAAIFANLHSIYQDAETRGIRVIAVSVCPWAHYKKWTPERQIETELLNDLIEAYAVSHPQFVRFVNAYAEFGMQGEPQRLSPRFDAGDGAHFSRPGDRKLAKMITDALTSFDTQLEVNQSARIRFSEPVTGVEPSHISLATAMGPVDFQLVIESSEVARIDFRTSINSITNLQLSVQAGLSGAGLSEIVDQAGNTVAGGLAAYMSVDYDSPKASVTTDQPRVTSSAVEFAMIEFNEDVFGLSESDIDLTRDDIRLDLTGLQIVALDARTYRLNFSSFEQTDGNYRLSVKARTTIVDTAGNAFLLASHADWVKLPVAPYVVSDTLYLTGTEDPDTIEIVVSATNIEFAIDGAVTSWQRDGVQRIELVTGGNKDIVSERVQPAAGPITIHATSNDSLDIVYLFDSLANDIFQAGPVDGALTNSEFQLQATGFGQVFGISRSGTDQARLFDSVGNDRMGAQGRISSLSGLNFGNYAYGFANVTGTAGSGGTDIAELSDSAGNDLFTSSPLSATLSVPGYSYTAEGFGRVNARTSTGNDRAVLNGSVGIENFTGQASGSSWIGAGFSQYVYGFDIVEAYGGGGNDKATLNDSPGNDTLEANSRYASLTLGTIRLSATDFARTNVYARSGNDTASFRGQSVSETLTGQPTFSSLTAGAYSTYAYGFDVVTADSGGGNDIATLYDSPSDDQLMSGPRSTTLTGPGFSISARDYRKVTAYARAGYDQAQLLGSPGNETGIGQSTFSSLIGPTFSNYAYAFDRVRLVGGGGTDIASLYDTTGNDTFEATPTSAKLLGAGYENTVDNFAKVNAFARQGNDIARLNGSTATETVTGKPTVTSMIGVGFANYANAFDEVTAQSGGGSDIASLYDTVADEEFIAGPSSASLIGATYRLNMMNYARVNAYAAGGNDRAILNGTSSAETYTGRPESSSLKGASFLLFASGFDNVTTNGGGGADLAYFYDSADDDQATVGFQSARMVGATYNNSVTNFARVSLSATLGINSATISDTIGNDRFTGLNNRGTLTSAGFTAILTDFTTLTLLASSGGIDRATQSSLTYQLNIGLGWLA